MAEAATGLQVELRSAFFDGCWPEDFWLEQQRRLPEMMGLKLLRYRRWQDRQLGLLGKLLLLEGLRERGFDDDCLSRLHLSPQGRPFLPGAPDFNIAHSGCGAVCAFASRGRVGIDLEEYRPLNPEEFTLVMTSEELAEVRAAGDPSRPLLRLWTAKESAAKAHGLGLGCDFKQLRLDRQRLRLAEREYVVRHLDLVPGYVCCLATEGEVTVLRLVGQSIGPAKKE